MKKALIIIILCSLAIISYSQEIGTINDKEPMSSVRVKLNATINKALSHDDSITSLRNASDLNYTFILSHLDSLSAHRTLLDAHADSITNLRSSIVDAGTVEISDINALGTPSENTFLRGDGYWRSVNAGEPATVMFSEEYTGGAYDWDTDFRYYKSAKTLYVNTMLANRVFAFNPIASTDTTLDYYATNNHGVLFHDEADDKVKFRYESTTYDLTTGTGSGASNDDISDSIQSYITGGTAGIALADSGVYDGGYVTPTMLANSGGGTMVYPGAGIPVSTGSAWGTSITDNSDDWNTSLQPSDTTVTTGYLETQYRVDTIKTNLRSEIAAIEVEGAGATFSTLKFIIGTTTNAPSNGDSTVTHGSLSGKHIEWYKNGVRQWYSSLSDSTLTVRPYYSTGDTIIIEASTSSAWTALSLRDTTEEGGTTTYSDDFSDGYTHGSYLDTYDNWTATDVGRLLAEITGGDTIVRPFNDLAYSLAYFTNHPSSNDHYAQVVFVASPNAGTYIGPAVRVSSTNGGSGYVARTNGSTIVVEKWVEGVRTQLASESVTVSGDDVLRLEVSGTTLTVKLNGSAVTAINGDGTITDSSNSSGRIGMGGYGDDGTRCDDFEGGNL